MHSEGYSSCSVCVSVSLRHSSGTHVRKLRALRLCVFRNSARRDRLYNIEKNRALDTTRSALYARSHIIHVYNM